MTYNIYNTCRCDLSLTHLCLCGLYLCKRLIIDVTITKLVCKDVSQNLHIYEGGG